eukprot:1000902_1
MSRRSSRLRTQPKVDYNKEHIYIGPPLPSSSSTFIAPSEDDQKENNVEEEVDQNDNNAEEEVEQKDNNAEEEVAVMAQQEENDNVADEESNDAVNQRQIEDDGAMMLLTPYIDHIKALERNRIFEALVQQYFFDLGYKFYGTLNKQGMENPHKCQK